MVRSENFIRFSYYNYRTPKRELQLKYKALYINRKSFEFVHKHITLQFSFTLWDGNTDDDKDSIPCSRKTYDL